MSCVDSTSGDTRNSLGGVSNSPVSLNPHMRVRGEIFFRRYIGENWEKLGASTIRG